MSSWVPPGRARERILAYGPMGSWKTVGALEIAQKIEGKVYAVDTDNAWEMILDRMYPELEASGKIDLATVSTWEEAETAINRAFRLATRDDFVALDSTSDLRDMGLDYVSGLMIGKDVPEYLRGFVAARTQEDAKKTGVQGSLVEMGLYDYFNPLWRKVIVRQTKASKCHVYLTAQAGEAGKNPREDALTKKLYGGFGFKPNTQKEIGFNAATVLLLDRNKVGKATYTVVKDWGRSGKELARDVAYESLAKDFLFKVAGWRPAKAGA